MNFKLSPLVVKELSRIKKTDQKLEKKIIKQLQLLKTNPRHPSLRLHKLTGNLTNMWSISITMNIRMIYHLLDDSTAYFVDIGTHDEVYGK
ncbi:MAG TPA: type II toxin-antitoxin system mRNA interferase toxin, RelE/StbE family [Candidatus Limnocylindrales bacterium]|nr:type II toxin-antitoxin system mRNA interferase toxin, RelE/StbE family [Candidatus Limnocylindrales bacterium]